MKRLCSIAGLCLSSFAVNAQVSTGPVLVEGGSNGIQVYQSKGYMAENQITTITEIKSNETPIFDPYQFIQDVERKISIHRENGNLLEVNALEKEINAVKQTYKIQ